MKQAAAWSRSATSKSGVYRRALRLIWSAAPTDVTLIGVLLLIQGLIPPVIVWLIKSIVDVISQRGSYEHGIVLVAIWAAASLIGQLATQWALLVQADLNERVTAYVEVQLMRKANSLPDLTAFEDPAFYDRLQVLNRQAANRPLNLIVTTATLVPSVIASVGLLILVGTLAWWLTPLLIVALIPLSYANAQLQQQSWQTILMQSPLTRALRYFASLCTTITYAKEVRVFGLGPYFEKRYRSAFDELRQLTTRARAENARTPVVATLLFVAANGLAFWWVAGQALSGHLSIGDVVLLLQGLNSLQQQLGRVASMGSVLTGHLLFFQGLFEFFDYHSPMRLATPKRHVSSPLLRGISFDAVSYRYPNGKIALAGVSFELRPGERVALVGENGAGKTTLVKLLCRLYDPVDGIIRVDGDDLRDLDLADWRERVGAVFQDFGRYRLTIGENVALGRLAKLDDIRTIERAAQVAGFAIHLPDFPDGFATQIGPEFGGVDLSGGQWQALGLARALIRDAEILILDEPTAALDPRSEHALFERFYELSKGKTTLLVTHRLASVRMADRILVLKHGHLVEKGTHDELLRLNGEYATLYRLQAEQYEMMSKESSAG